MQRYTVSGLVRALQQLFDAQFPEVWVEGEVVRISSPSSGHRYFDLRHEDAVLPAVVWKSQWASLTYRPKDGERVICKAKLGIYGPQGRTQLYVTRIEAVGQGDWAAEVKRRKLRLFEDGLLDPARKRPLPAFPRVVGVATSVTGAALQDFLVVSGRRYPAAKIVVANCLVQGEKAEQSMIEALDALVRHGQAEVIVLTRGGGSEKDLAAFQSELLCRAIAASRVPVLSAVGHQVDVSLVDLVADVSAPTPSAAAERLFPDAPALRQTLDGRAIAMDRAMDRALLRRRQAVEGLAGRLRTPEERIRADRARVDDLWARLHAAVVIRSRISRTRVEGGLARLDAGIVRNLALSGRSSERMEQRLQSAWKPQLPAARARLGVAVGQLEALSPLGVLSRGYAIVKGPQGLIRDADDAPVGTHLHLRLARGRLLAEVLSQAPMQESDG